MSEKVKKLISENELEAALDLLIGAGDQLGEERLHTLIVLKNRLSALEEQELAGILDFEEIMQQKAKIAHALLKITEGKKPDSSLVSPPPAQVETPAPERKSSAQAAPKSRYLLAGALTIAAIVAIFFVMKSFGENHPADPGQETTRQNDPPENKKTDPAESAGQVRLLNFPKLDQPFNFSDIQYTFREASLEKYSDGSASQPATLKLTLKLDLRCRSNLGVCYREEMRVLVDGTPVAPAERENLAGWMEHNSSARDVLTFIFDAGANEYHVQLEKDKSFWKRGFKILM